MFGLFDKRKNTPELPKWEPEWRRDIEDIKRNYSYVTLTFQKFLEDFNKHPGYYILEDYHAKLRSPKGNAYPKECDAEVIDKINALRLEILSSNRYTKNTVSNCSEVLGRLANIISLVRDDSIPHVMNIIFEIDDATAYYNWRVKYVTDKKAKEARQREIDSMERYRRSIALSEAYDAENNSPENTN